RDFRTDAQNPTRHGAPYPRRDESIAASAHRVGCSSSSPTATVKTRWLNLPCGEDRIGGLRPPFLARRKPMPRVGYGKAGVRWGSAKSNPDVFRPHTAHRCFGSPIHPPRQGEGQEPRLLLAIQLGDVRAIALRQQTRIRIETKLRARIGDVEVAQRQLADAV